MLKSVQLHGVGPVKNLAANFGERLNVFTGDNGLGKSFLLDISFWALSGIWPSGRMALPSRREAPRIIYHTAAKKGASKPKEATYDPVRQAWRRPAGRPAMPGLVIYAAVDGSFTVWDPARNYYRQPDDPLDLDGELPHAYQFSPETLTNGLEEPSGRVLCNGLVRDWVSWFYQHDSEPNGDAGVKPYALLRGVIERLSHPDEPIQPARPRRVYVNDSRLFPAIEMPYGIVAFPQISAGVRRVISLAYLLVWSWYEHAQAAALQHEPPAERIILLVDEIEAHLHPKWQRTILPALLGVANSLHPGTQVQILTATHSPLILASLEPAFVPDTDRLFAFDLDGAAVTFHDLPWTNHGDAVGWLTSPIFGLKQARSREAEVAIERAEAYMRGETAGLPAKATLHRQLRHLLADSDPFWPRWVVTARP